MCVCFILNNISSKSPADDCWVKNFSGLLKHGFPSVESERCISISAKTQSLSCCQRVHQVLLSVLDSFEESFSIIFAEEEIPKKTCMLVQHALSKDSQALILLKWSWSYLSLRSAMKTNAVEKCYEQVLWFVVVLDLDSVLPFQVLGVAFLLSSCLHTWMLVSFFLCRLSLFSVNFHFMLPELSQLGTENKAEKMFIASHISLKKVSLASSGLFRDFFNKDPANVCWTCANDGF